MGKDELHLAARMDRWAMQHRDEMVRDLIEWIQIRSVVDYGAQGAPMGPGCKQASDALLALGRKYGLETENIDDHCACISYVGDSQRPELGILGHLDTVPEGNGWRFEPFYAIEKDGYVIGRGSCDDKGPVIMALYALRCMKEFGLPLNVRLIVGCDEEREMRDVRRYLALRNPPVFTINCDGGWAACIGEKGMIAATIMAELESADLMSLHGGTAENMIPDEAKAVIGERIICVQGISAHCSTPTRGQNAIRKLLDQLSDVGYLPAALGSLRHCIADDDGTGLGIAYSDERSGKTTCCPTLLRTVGKQVMIRLNIRYAITQNGEALIRSMRKRCDQRGMKLDIISHFPPRSISPDSPEVKCLTDTVQMLLGKGHKPYATGGMTHSRYFPNSIPFGPFSRDPRLKHSFGQAHGPDEAVSIQELLSAIKVYIIALLRLDRHFDLLPTTCFLDDHVV